MVGVKIWTEISGERLAGNFAALRRTLEEKSVHGEDSQPPIELLAVVKANAYGHGIDPCAPILARAGARWLGVTDAHEGARTRLALHAAGPPAQPHEAPAILVMSGTSGLAGEAECILRNRLTPVVWSPAHLERLAAAARAAGLESPLPVHLEVDSGMSRQGVAPGPELAAALRFILAEPRLALDGLLTHFAATEVAAAHRTPSQTADQQLRFATAVDQVAAAGLRPRWVHVGNSSYIDNRSPSAPLVETGNEDSLHWLRRLARRLDARPMVRSGLALYGHLLPIEGPGTSLVAGDLLAVMTWKTRIIGLREVTAGTLVGYSGSFAAPHPMRLALLPVGYADGLRRELSSTSTRPGGWVVIHGQRAPIVGRVSMNLTTVDVTAIPSAAEGDEATLLGDGISAEDHAGLARTIPYEILCAVRHSP
jgi:alanine racemase